MPNARKIVISPAQALLILIDHYKLDERRMMRLKRFFLAGATTLSESMEIQSLIEDPLLEAYDVSYSPQVINNDATRRYFETHLAYNTLKCGLELFEITELTAYFAELNDLVDRSRLDAKQCQLIDDVINGRAVSKGDNTDKEYSHYIEKLKAGKIFSDFSPDERDKIILFVQSAYIGIVITLSTNLPLNIYGQGQFSKEFRGKMLVTKQDSTRSQNLGLLKGYMPLARDDAAFSESELPYVKASDQSTYIESAGWVESNFNQLVHPFSNSISGTILAQLRALAQLQWYCSPSFMNFSTKLTDFFKLLIASRLYHNGGHSLHEFVSPFYIQKIQDEFFDIRGFSEINLISMFFDNNEPAYEKALDDTVEYNRMLLKRALTRHELMNRTHPRPNAECAATTRFFSKTVDTELQPTSRLQDLSPSSVVEFNK